MSSRGVHFSVTRGQMNRLLRIASNQELDPEERDEAVLEQVIEIEEQWNRDELFQTDKAWDAIHRCLTGDDTPKGRLNPGKGDYPLKLCFLGGAPLYSGRDYTITLIEPGQVADLARALKGIDEGWMRERFFRLKPRATLYPINEEEFQYAWGNFQGFPEFVARAAAKRRASLFTVDH